MRARSRHLQRRGPSVGGGHPLLGIPRQPRDTVTLREALRLTREAILFLRRRLLPQLAGPRRLLPQLAGPRRRLCPHRRLRHSPGGTMRARSRLGQLQENQRDHPRERLHPERARATCRTSRVLLTVMTPLLVSGGPWKSPLTSCPAKHLQEILRVPYFDGSVPKNMAIILIILRVSRARYLRAKLVEKQYDATVRRGREKLQTKGKW